MERNRQEVNWRETEPSDLEGKAKRRTKSSYLDFAEPSDSESKLNRWRVSSDLEGKAKRRTKPSYLDFTEPNDSESKLNRWRVSSDSDFEESNWIKPIDSDLGSSHTSDNANDSNMGLIIAVSFVVLVGILLF